MRTKHGAKLLEAQEVSLAVAAYICLDQYFYFILKIVVILLSFLLPVSKVGTMYRVLPWFLYPVRNNTQMFSSSECCHPDDAFFSEGLDYFNKAVHVLQQQRSTVSVNRLVKDKVEAPLPRCHLSEAKKNHWILFVLNSVLFFLMRLSVYIKLHI